MGRQSRLKAQRRAERQEQAVAAASERAVAAEQRRLARERGAIEGPQRGCLICRRSDGGFETEEHVIPESLGNKTWRLPPGVVCDRCNHSVCAPLDEALCNYHLIHSLRLMHGVPSKKGVIPTANFDNGTVESPEPGKLVHTVRHRRWISAAPTPAGGTVYAISHKRDSDARPDRLARVHRALVKQALEFAWIDLGERVLGSGFDHLRTIILEGGHHGYLSMFDLVAFSADGLRSGIDYAELHRDGVIEPGLYFVAWLLGWPIITDTLHSEPTGKVTSLLTDSVIADLPPGSSSDLRVLKF